jgi:prepilin-type processing-associated H-X9-DG protein
VDDTNAPAGENAIEVSELGEAFVLRGMALFTLADRGWKLVGFSGASQPKRPADEKSDQCFDQLRQLGLAFMVWAGDNNDRFPFNVSTNVGGTKEFCAPAGNGFDANAAMHFQVMSNELSTPKILVCPGDSSKAPAANFNVLEAENVSYLIHAGTEVDEAHPNAVLARCPVHGHTLYCDGHVERGSKK